MGTPPVQPQDAFESINSTAGSGSIGLNPGPEIPAGYADRQSKRLNNLPAVNVRNMVRWLVPNSGVIEMYINPNTIRYDYKKVISSSRTKGGYSLQYWGEDLIKLTLSGTTGSSGIEGINVLYDVYRAEQLAFDSYALALAAQADAENNSVLSLLAGFGLPDTGALGDAASLLGASSGIPRVAYQHPTLATLAFQVEMYWSGWVYRGYFEGFSVDESADKIGLFNYTINFTATQRRGRRDNFMPWHRSATSGPSNNDSTVVSLGGAPLGRPLSYGGISQEFIAPPSAEESTSGLVSEWNDLAKL